MSSDQLVRSKLILASVLDLQRQGSGRLLEELERAEPDLAEYLLENLSLIHQKLLALGAKPKESQRLIHRIESLALVCISSLQRAYRQLWEQSADPKLRELDPAAEMEDPPPPQP